MDKKEEPQLTDYEKLSFFCLRFIDTMFQRGAVQGHEALEISNVRAMCEEVIKPYVQQQK